MNIKEEISGLIDIIEEMLQEQNKEYCEGRNIIHNGWDIYHDKDMDEFVAKKEGLEFLFISFDFHCSWPFISKEGKLTDIIPNQILKFIYELDVFYDDSMGGYMISFK